MYCSFVSDKHVQLEVYVFVNFVNVVKVIQKSMISETSGRENGYICTFSEKEVEFFVFTVFFCLFLGFS